MITYDRVHSYEPQTSPFAYQNIIFSYFPTKTYVVGIQRTISMRRFFWAPKTLC